MASPADGAHIPVPDPTTLTTQQLREGLLSLREILESRLNALDSNISRLQVELRNESQHLRVLYDEKFARIDMQFAERDRQDTQYQLLTEKAVDAALTSAKAIVSNTNEAFEKQVDKSEKSVIGQMDRLLLLIQATAQSSNDRLTKVENRLDTGEGRGSGYSASWGLALSILFILGMVVNISITLFSK